ncbi:hypothetical protein J1614_005158 [Plenodomus biglobosus]|nr:hypothetical protein J1614_005158 [Plenodomus biglobosus]
MSDIQTSINYATLFDDCWNTDMTTTLSDGLTLNEHQEPWDPLFDEALNEMTTLGDVQESVEPSSITLGHSAITIDPSVITLDPTASSPIFHDEHELSPDPTEAVSAGSTIEDLQQHIAHMQYEHEEEITKLKEEHAVEIDGMKADIEELKEDHDVEIDGMQFDIDTLKKEHAVEIDGMKFEIETLKAALEHFKKAQASKSPQAPKTPQATPPHKRGLIETMWSPETTPEQRRELLKGRKEPPLHPGPIFQNKMAARLNNTSSPTARMATEATFYNNANYVPAMGSSAALCAITDNFHGDLLYAQCNNPPTLGPKNKGKAKARAPAASKRTAAAATAKVTKSTPKGKSSGPSPAAMRSLEELYRAQFHTLSQEEKCHLMLPLLQGFNPETGSVVSGASPGRLATDADFAYIGEDTTDFPVLREALRSYQEPSEPLVPIARSLNDLAMVQLAAQELGPDAMGGAMRQQEALQRTQPRRR